MPIAIFQISDADKDTYFSNAEGICKKVLDQVLNGLEIPDPEDREIRIVLGEQSGLNINFTVGGDEYHTGDIFDPSENLIRKVLREIKLDLPNIPVSIETYQGSVFRIVDPESEEKLEITEAQKTIKKAEFKVVFDEKFAEELLETNIGGAGNNKEGAPRSVDIEMTSFAKKLVEGAIDFAENPSVRAETATIADSNIAVEMMADQADEKTLESMANIIELTMRKKGYEGTIWLMSKSGRKVYE